MTDGPQQPDERQGSDEEFRPRPGQPTLPFHGGTQPPAAPQQGQPGYGYPQQQSGYGYPQQSGYGYPQAQPEPETPANPAWAPPSTHIGEGGSSQKSAGEPDWSALAARTEQGNKRRKLFLVGGGVLAVVVVAGIVATAVTISGKHKHVVADPTTTPTAAQPSTTFSDVTPPPPANPLMLLSSAKTDTAPLTASGIFPGHQLDFGGGRKYTKAALSSTGSCSAVAGPSLAPVLSQYGCREMLRATYYRGGTAVTVGVAVFGTASAADSAKDHAVPYILPLSGDGVAPFCRHTSCQSTANAVGRYAYFTMAGRTDNAPVSVSDPTTRQCATDVADLAFQSIVQRGRTEAATATPGG